MGNLERYLQKYAEPEVRLVEQLEAKFSYVLVIPAYRESLEAVQQTWRHLTDVLIILVVNSPSPGDPETLALLEQFERHWRRTWTRQHCQLVTNGENTILIVDRCNIPLANGVGEARKIGSDIACKLISNGSIETPIIFNTDADAELPANYFHDVLPAKSSFQIFRFRHKASDNLSAALYELSLLWYAAGLKEAGSIYGYTSIGSTIACSAESYASVRGFPKRKAGEDFYLMNKLRKVGNYNYSKADPIELSSRPSERVPFGTGPAIRRLDALQKPMNEFEFYHPGCFVSLGKFLTLLTTIQDRTDDLNAYFQDPLHQQYIEESGFGEQVLKHRSQSEGVFKKFLLDWFDGFRTLKFVHFLRNNGYPSVTFSGLWNSHLLPNDKPGSTFEDIQLANDKLWEKILV